jgi:hypothetical protein
MDNAQEICTRWLSEIKAQNGTGTSELESGRILFFVRDEEFFTRRFLPVAK